MVWTPITLVELRLLVMEELAECSDEQRTFFDSVRVPPTKWSQSPWGDEGNGFWVVALHQKNVLWYNDIEGGFNVSEFRAHGTIPDAGYWCNQDPLKWALQRLQGEPGPSVGQPEPLSTP